jgi:hypothetical protein
VKQVLTFDVTADKGMRLRSSDALGARLVGTEWVVSCYGRQRGGLRRTPRPPSAGTPGTGPPDRRDSGRGAGRDR